ESSNSVFRYSEGGSLDGAYGEGGSYRIGGVGSNAVSMAVDPAGRQLLAAWSGRSDTLELRRLTPSGQLDPSFGVGRPAAFECRCELENLHLIQGPDGSVTISASSETGPWGGSDEVAAYGLTRVLSDGTLDTDFGTDGTALFYMRATDPFAWATAENGA